MSNRKTVDPEYYENNSFADEFAEAIENGTLIKAVPGKSIVDVARERHLASQASGTGSFRQSTPIAAASAR